MSESIMMDVRPFPNPANKTESDANVVAAQYYASEFAREENVCQTMFSVHPNDPAKVYMVHFGWTADGWRVMASILDESNFAQWSNNVREFVMAYARASSVRKAGELGITKDIIDQMLSSIEEGTMSRDEIFDQVAAKLAEQPDCGDPECPVHGGDKPFDGAAFRESLLADRD